MNNNNDDKMNFQNEIDLIQEVMEDPIMAIPFLGNITAIIKSDCYKNGIREFPTICMIGKPQSGKTFLSRALDIMSDGEDELIVSSTRKDAIQKKCRDKANSYLILDDFANFSSPDTKRKSCNLLDCVIRPSYSGQTAQLIMTAEPEMRESITDSLRTRIIFLNMNGWKNNQNKKTLIRASKYHDKLVSFFAIFREWFQKQSLDYDTYRYTFEENFSKVRIKYPNIEDRIISNIYMIDLSRRLLSEFFKSEFNITLYDKTLVLYYENLMTDEQYHSPNNNELIKHFLFAIFQDDTFEFAKPHPCVCANAARGEACDGSACPCRLPKNEFLFYNPVDLTGYPIVFIQNPKYLSGYPNYMATNESLLVIPVNLLVGMLNTALDAYCIENDFNHKAWTPKNVTEQLKELGLLIFYHYGERDFYQFTNYPYQLLLREDRKKEPQQSVYILRLQGDLQKIFLKRPGIDMMEITSPAYYTDAIQLRSIWSKCRTFYISNKISL